MAQQSGFEMSLTLEYLDDEIAVYGPGSSPQIIVHRATYDAFGRPGRLSASITAEGS